MLKLIIEDDEGRKEIIPFVRDEMTVGRQDGNTIRLQERNISRRHARLSRQNGHLLVEDLGSYNGIRVNGERITGKCSVHDGDLIQIGDFELAVQADTATNALPPPGPATASGEFSVVSSGSWETSTDSSVETVITQLSSDPRQQVTAVIHVDELDAQRHRTIEEVPLTEAPRLVVLNTELAGQEFSCIRSQVSMGRADENDFTLDHRSLSRFHAKLVKDVASGDWQIVDLQSANGVTVNGETYGQATLRGGDVVGLGHVQLKFLAPGEVARFSRRSDWPAEPHFTPARPSNVKYWILGAGALAIAAAIFFHRRPPIVSEVSAVEEAPRIQEAAALPSNAANWDHTVAEARSALATRNLDQARSLLEADGAAERPRAAEELLDRVRAEQLVRKNLAAAETSIGKGDLPEAQKLLAESEGTELFSTELSQVKSKLRKLWDPRKLEEKKAPPVKKAAAAPKPDASSLYAEGYNLFKGKQFPEAAQAFSHCLDADASFASCHLMLGSTYAKMKNLEKGAYHYRQFVRLAPNDEQTPKIRKMLEQYDASNGGQ